MDDVINRLSSFAVSDSGTNPFIVERVRAAAAADADEQHVPPMKAAQTPSPPPPQPQHREQQQRQSPRPDRSYAVPMVLTPDTSGARERDLLGVIEELREQLTQARIDGGMSAGINGLLAEMKRAREELASQREIYEQSLFDEEAKRKAAEAENAKLVARLKALNTEIESLRQSLDEKQQEYTTLQDGLKKATDEVARLRTLKRDAEERWREQEVELESQQKALDEALEREKANEAKLEDTFVNLRRANTMLIEKIGQHVDKENALKDEIERLGKTITDNNDEFVKNEAVYLARIKKLDEQLKTYSSS